MSIDVYDNLIPLLIVLSGIARTTELSSCIKPVKRNSDINFPICLFGKLTTQVICFHIKSFIEYKSVI
jgi:hypothetical protein